MTFGLTLVSNVLMYLGYRKLKEKKHKKRQKEYEIAFSRYQTKSDNAITYLRENQIFIQSSHT